MNTDEVWEQVLELLTAANLTSYSKMMDDGYPSVVIRTREEAAQVAVGVLVSSGLLRPGGEIRRMFGRIYELPEEWNTAARERYYAKRHEDVAYESGFENGWTHASGLLETLLSDLSIQHFSGTEMGEL